MSSAQPRVAVIGAGIVGLCTAYALRQRGSAVVVYEASVPGAGQSGGSGRLLRHYHEDERLISWAARSRALYETWGSSLGVEAISPGGAITIGASAPARLEVLQRLCVEARMLEPGELRRRVPVLGAVETTGMLDEQGGAIRTTAITRALVSALEGCIIPAEVEGVELAGDGGVVRTSNGRSSFDRVVVCAGRDTPALAAGVGLEIPVSAHTTLRCTFLVRGAVGMLASLQDPDGALGAAMYACAGRGRESYAVGLTGAGLTGADLRAESLGEWAAATSSYVRRVMPGLEPAPVSVRQCTVTELPWGHDGVGVWEKGNVLAIAGHNLYKHAPALGEALADAVLSGVLDPELRPTSELGRRCPDPRPARV